MFVMAMIAIILNYFSIFDISILNANRIDIQLLDEVILRYKFVSQYSENVWQRFHKVEARYGFYRGLQNYSETNGVLTKCNVLHHLRHIASKATITLLKF
jgi:hypothetical protein